MLKKILLGVAFVATLLTGVAIGVSGDAQPTAAPTPAKTVQVPGPTKTVKQPVPGPTVTTEVEKRVAGTPAVCVTALDKGDTVIQIAAEGFSIVSGVLNAASQLDVAAMEAGTQELNALQPSLIAARQEYDSNSASCRAQQ